MQVTETSKASSSIFLASTWVNNLAGETDRSGAVLRAIRACSVAEEILQVAENSLPGLSKIELDIMGNDRRKHGEFPTVRSVTDLLLEESRGKEGSKDLRVLVPNLLRNIIYAVWGRWNWVECLRKKDSGSASKIDREQIVRGCLEGEYQEVERRFYSLMKECGASTLSFKNAIYERSNNADMYFCKRTLRPDVEKIRNLLDEKLGLTDQQKKAADEERGRHIKQCSVNHGMEILFQKILIKNQLKELANPGPAHFQNQI